MQRRIQVHLHIQGDLPTAYRSAVQREATRIGAVGWVRNSEVTVDAGDDSEHAPITTTVGVEVVMQGSEMVVLQLRRWCERGPLSAAVTSVVATDQPREAFLGFDVRR